MASRSEGELPSSSDDSSSSQDSSSDERVDIKKPAESALKFKNDGSFLEMFKKMQEGKKEEPNSKETAERLMTNNESASSPSSSSTDHSKVTKPLEAKKPGLMSIVGKRRGGKVLPTGVVKKQKRPEDEEDQSEKKDAWSQYMSEVKKYKERLGDEEDKNRPLVK